MRINHYVIPHKGTAWYGLKRVNCWPDKIQRPYRENESRLNKKGIISERQLEVDCFLSILDDCEGFITLFELGAGWGEWSMALSNWRKDYKCIAVEAMPSHLEQCRTHFDIYKINGEVVSVAVSNKNGFAKFGNYDPYTNGQSLCFNGTNKAFGLFNSLIGRSVDVQTMTLDSLVKEYGKPTIVHMDVQGAESSIMESSEHVADYYMIGTHGKSHNKRITRRLKSQYDSVVDIMPNSLTNVENVGLVKTLDGLQVWKRRI